LTETISVIGLGYVGLPLAIAAANSGYKVIGVDKDLKKIELICGGSAQIDGIDHIELRSLIDSKQINVGTEYSAIENSKIIIVCVPTPLTKDHKPDLGFVIGATEELSPFIKKDTLIVFESTVSPGTTREVLAPLIHRNSSLKNSEYFIAFSPERIDPANLIWNVKNTPKLVAGMNTEAVNKAGEFYSKFIDKVIVCESLEIAETAKLLENSFRLLNIAFINELSNFCSRQGIDILKVIEAASNKPYGFMPFYPSLGAGGHCIPVDPVYLSTKANEVGAPTKLLELAQQINANTPKDYVKRLESKVGKVKGKRVLVIGIAYKANVADVRESSALILINELRRKKAIVNWHDELVKEWDGEKSVGLGGQFDFAIVATQHNDVDISQLNAIDIYDSRSSVI
jgi:UDP-N-acetyl-D-glucosamine dehydrogenase